MMKKLPNDVARCLGVSCTEDGVTYWREGCEDCQRRLAAESDGPDDWVSWMEPPELVVFECWGRVAP